MLMGFKIFFGPPGPAQRHLHGLTAAFAPGGMLGAFIESHNDVAAEGNLNFNGALRGKQVRGAIEMRAEIDAVFADFAQFIQAEDLKAARVSKKSAVPAHEAMQSAEPANQFVPRTQI